MELYRPEHPTIMPQCLILMVRSFVLSLGLSTLAAAGWVSATGSFLRTGFMVVRAVMEWGDACRLKLGSAFSQSWCCSAPVIVGLNLLGFLSVKISICTCCIQKWNAAGGSWISHTKQLKFSLKQINAIWAWLFIWPFKISEGFWALIGLVWGLLDILKGSMTSLQKPRGSSMLWCRAHHLVTAACGACASH